jgi:hypothetical protein
MTGRSVGWTHQWDDWLVGPACQVNWTCCGTHCKGRLVGPRCHVGWWELNFRMKFANLDGHIDMTRRSIAEVLI